MYRAHSEVRGVARSDGVLMREGSITEHIMRYVRVIAGDWKMK